MARKLDLPGALQTAIAIARAQGEIVLSRWTTATCRDYKNRRDFATEVDLEVERNIKEALLESFPDHGFQGEETGKDNESAEYRWLVDPIDGTKYYAACAGLFAVSLGLMHEGEPVLGVVYSPTTRQCFSASRLLAGDGRAGRLHRPDGIHQAGGHRGGSGYHARGRLSPRARAGGDRSRPPRRRLRGALRTAARALSSDRGSPGGPEEAYPSAEKALGGKGFDKLGDLKQNSRKQF